MKKATRFLADLAITFGGVAIRDGLCVAAVGSITYGAALIYRPAGWIVFGVLVIAALLMNARSN